LQLLYVSKWTAGCKMDESAKSLYRLSSPGACLLNAGRKKSEIRMDSSKSIAHSKYGIRRHAMYV